MTKKKILIASAELEEFAAVLRDNGYDVEFVGPETEVGESLQESAAVVLKPGPGDVRLAALLRRQSRAVSTATRERLRVGLSFNMKRSKDSDEEAEFDAPRTIDALEEAIASHGLEVLRVEADRNFPSALEEAAPDFVFNIAEGFRERSRESQVPALLEFRGIPFAGSDSVATSITLDKVLAKKIVRSAGLDTPRFQTFYSAREKADPSLRFPLIVKPAAEGSSKGILAGAVVHTPEELKERVAQCVSLYKQAALVEEYISGREFTVGLIGNRKPEVLPILEVAFTSEAGDYPVYGYEIKQEIVAGARYLCPAPLEDGLRRKIERRAREIFRALELRDFARVDFRLASDGTLHFLEVNPLPGLTPGYSDLCVIGKAMGLNHEELVGYILLAAMKRCGIARKHWPKLEPLKERLSAFYASLK